MSIDPTLKFRFSDVAHAIDTTPKSLRNWLQRSQVSLNSSQPADGRWRFFELEDVASLALVRAIVRFGIEVKEADIVARGIIGQQEDLFSVGNDDAIHVSDFGIYLWPFEDSWKFTAFDRVSPFWEMTDLSEQAIVLRAGVIISRAFDRALGRLAQLDTSDSISQSAEAEGVA